MQHQWMTESAVCPESHHVQERGAVVANREEYVEGKEKSRKARHLMGWPEGLDGR